MTTSAAGATAASTYEDRLNKAISAYGKKVALVTLGATSLGVGLVCTVLFAFDQGMATWGLLGEIHHWLRGTSSLAAAGWSLVVNGIGWLTFAGASNIAAYHIGRHSVLQHGTFSAWGRFCAALSRGPRSAAIRQVLAGFVFLPGILFMGLSLHGVLGFDLGLLARTLPLCAGISGWLIGVGAATFLAKPPAVRLPDRPGGPPTALPPGVPPARATGEQLLTLLKGSAFYRRQNLGAHAMQAWSYLEGDGFDLLQDRYARTCQVLEQSGIRSLSQSQSAALRRVLEIEAKGLHEDFAFIGWPGSGRTTLANALSLSAALNREGAMYCITPESPSRNVTADGIARHPVTQFREWLGAAGLDEVVRIQESYDEDGSDELRLGAYPDLVFTDVRKLADSVLQNVHDDGKLLIERLKYVVIDHPQRLPREELVRLRLAIARLRITAELLGRPLTFLLILPWLDNAEEFAKWLLNNAQVHPRFFNSWHGRCHLVTWMPPHELYEYNDNDTPLFVRGEFTREVLDLLSELGFQSHQLDKPLRVAVVDVQSLLGPEAQEYLRDEVVDRLKADLRGTADESQVLRITQDWAFFGTIDVAVDRARAYDVVICVGLGGQPEYLVASLRAAVADDGAMILIGDSSPEDYETIRVITSPGWTPDRAREEIRFPVFVLPGHSDALVAYELANLFQDFREPRTPIPLERLLGAFPTHHAARLIERWQEERYLTRSRVFETIQEGTSPRQAEYVTCVDERLQAKAFEIPWGCLTRDVYRVHDTSASDYDQRIPYIDTSRVFIDHHPQAMRRAPPATVEVAEIRVRAERPSEADRSTRYRELGEIRVKQAFTREAIVVDRRKPRVRTTLLHDRPMPGRPPFLSEDERQELRQKVVRPVLSLLDDASDDAADLLLRALLKPILGRAGTTPYSLSCGSWVLDLEELIRDVALTDTRLVEEPRVCFTVALKGRHKRSYSCVGTSLFVELPPTGEPEDLQDELRPYMAAYATYHAFARAFEAFLRKKFLNLAAEYRVAVVPCGTEETRPETVAPYRLITYRLHEDELQEDRYLSWLGDKPEALTEALQFVWRRLLDCDCVDGCSRCCAGLGLASLADYEQGRVRHDQYAAEDLVSRRGGYVMACALLGRSPDWRRFATGAGPRLGPPVPGEAPPTTTFPPPEELPPITSDEELAALLAETIGTKDGRYQDGIWTDLFGALMELEAEHVAQASWMPEDDPKINRCAGYYRFPANIVRLKSYPDRELLKEIIIHEYVHCWQWMSDAFDMSELRKSPQAKRYFGGLLVTEGAATWAESQYRFRIGRGPSYEPRDGRNWNEYKVGYFLMEKIERAVGTRGLFAWLKHGRDAPPDAGIRSREPGLPWPFSLQQALDHFELTDAATRGDPSNFDVELMEEELEEDQAVAPASSAPPNTSTPSG